MDKGAGVGNHDDSVSVLLFTLVRKVDERSSETGST